jgi:hypothetical protein
MDIKAYISNNRSTLAVQELEYTNSGVALSWIIEDGVFGDFLMYKIYKLKTEELGEIEVAYEGTTIRNTNISGIICPTTIYNFKFK